jgi:transposase
VRISTAPAREKKNQDQAIGRSRGGLSTKIHATVDALGNPTGFHLTGSQACDLDGADVLLPDIGAKTILADKGYDADVRVLEPLARAGKTAVIPAKCTRKNRRFYYKHLYKTRHLIENFFLANSNSSEPLQPAMTRLLVTSWLPSISRQPPSGRHDQLQLMTHPKQLPEKIS